MTYPRIAKNMVLCVVGVFAAVAALSLAPVARGAEKVQPGPRGPVGPDVALTDVEKILLAKRVGVRGFTAEAVQAACDKAVKENIPVVFLPAGKYLFEKTVNVPGGITILGEGSATHCLSDGLKRAAFAIKEPNARVTRLRLQGPSARRDMKDYSTGLWVTAENTRIDHCEIYNFCRGINVVGGGGQIDHNHIHHCIRDGLGYGVSMYAGARVLINDNDFGPCRHCLASNGALDWSSPDRLGKYVHKPKVRKTHWELVHNRFYGDETTDYHRHWVIDTHPGMDGTFVVENNVLEDIRRGLGIRDGRGIIKGNRFQNVAGTAIIIRWGKHNGIVVEGTMPRDIAISGNSFEKVSTEYDIGKAENITIDGRIVEGTKVERKTPLPPIMRLKPIAAAPSVGS